MSDLKIILVEDNDIDARSALATFAEGGLSNAVIRFTTANDAWNYLSTINIRNLPTAFLIDLQLPGMKGVELIHLIKSDDKFKFIPVIVLTGLRDDKHVLETYKLHVDAHVIKPIDSIKFKKIMNAIGIG